MESGVAWAWLALPLAAASGLLCARVSRAYVQQLPAATEIDGALVVNALKQALSLQREAGVGQPLAMLCALLMAAAWLPFALQPEALFAARGAACAALLVLALIDARSRLLPDAITLPLLWAGLLVAWAGVGVNLRDAVLAAALAYLLLWAVNALFYHFRGRDGLGGGDMKLAAALGAWLGWAPLPALLLAACVSGISFAFASRGRRAWRASLPLGPFLAAAGAAGLVGAPVVQFVFCPGVAACTRWVSPAG